MTKENAELLFAAFCGLLLVAGCFEFAEFIGFISDNMDSIMCNYTSCDGIN